MDYTAFPEPIRPGWGRIFHGGAITGSHPLRGGVYFDPQIFELPAPLVIVNVNGGELNEQIVAAGAGNVVAVLSRWFGDQPSETIPDDVLVAFANAVTSLLASGMNVYIHCAAGLSRSTYIHAAVRMRALSVTRDEAFAQIARYRPQINPNQGFRDHLLRLQPRLMGTPA